MTPQDKKELKFILQPFVRVVAISIAIVAGVLILIFR